MIKKTLGRRFLSLVLALVFTMSLAVPSSAMGFDDLQTVVDMPSAPVWNLDGTWSRRSTWRGISWTTPPSRWN